MRGMKPAHAVLAALAVTILAGGCGGPAGVAAHQSPAAVSTPSPASSPSPAPPSYSVNLVLTGGLTGTMSQTQADANSGCGAGRFDVNVIYKGQAWSLGASVTGYHGPGRYALSDGFNLMLSSPTYDIWMST